LNGASVSDPFPQEVALRVAHLIMHMVVKFVALLLQEYTGEHKITEIKSTFIDFIDL
jgi:hypothetical protein